MKRNNILSYVSRLIICPLFLSMTSCADWLDVKMSDNIMENTLFSTNEGFLIALNGAYVDMVEIYGSDLSAGVIDVMAQYYKVTDNDDHSYRAYSYYRYNESTFENRSGSIWSNAYTVLANINVLLDHCDEAGSALSPLYYPIVKGEALALRAMIHFDMLRLYGPIYSEATASQETIPYQEDSSRDIQPLLSAREVMQKVLRDLNEAVSILAQGDPILTDGVRNAVASDDGLDSYDFAYRQLRMNYYAAQALRARAYLWIGDKQTAYQIAKNEIIDRITTDELTVFPWATEESVLQEGKPDRLFSSEVFFAVYDMTRSLYSSMFSSSRSISSRLTFPGSGVSAADSKLTTFYDDPNDLRLTMWDVTSTQNESEDGVVTVDASLYFMKYAEASNEVSFDGTETYRYMIPLIRLSEVYLIAAECAETDEEAIGYINAIREHRRCADVSLANGTRDRLILYEFAREMIGEGQLFFYYKRLGMEEIISGTSVSEPYYMTLSNYVWPMPLEAEMNKRTEVEM